MPRLPQGTPVTCWLIDTRTIWQGDKIEQVAPEALELISPEERENVKRKYHIADAKMSLASALLKRLFFVKATGLTWAEARFTRKGDPKHGKPCILLPNGNKWGEFNISHQAGLVALVGWNTDKIELGVDIVCVNERNDHRHIDQEGFDGYVDIYQEIFSDEESWDMKYNVDPFKLLDGTTVTQEDIGRSDRCVRRNQELEYMTDMGSTETFSSDLLIDAKLRRFYAFWSLKEAWIKLVGEGLLAKWIREVEFRNVRAPTPGTVARCSTHGTWGERVTDVEVWFQQKKEEDVRIEIQAYEEDFMITVAARPGSYLPSGNKFPDFEKLDVEQDVIEVAKAS